MPLDSMPAKFSIRLLTSLKEKPPEDEGRVGSAVLKFSSTEAPSLTRTPFSATISTSWVGAAMLSVELQVDGEDIVVICRQMKINE
jgi:hypothetical protein